MAKPIVESFAIAQAAELAGLTTAMVDYLCRENVLIPSSPAPRGRGRARAYSFGDVVMLRALARLLGAGVSVQRLKKALLSLRPKHKEISREALPARFIVTDGSRVFLRNEKGVLDLDGTGQMSFFFVLQLEHVRRDVLRMEMKGYANGRG